MLLLIEREDNGAAAMRKVDTIDKPYGCIAETIQD